jgi:hypothetical protein
VIRGAKFHLHLNGPCQLGVSKEKKGHEVKVTVKLSLCLTEHHTVEVYGELEV